MRLPNRDDRTRQSRRRKKTSGRADFQQPAEKVSAVWTESSVTDFSGSRKVDSLFGPTSLSCSASGSCVRNQIPMYFALSEGRHPRRRDTRHYQLSIIMPCEVFLEAACCKFSHAAACMISAPPPCWGYLRVCGRVCAHSCRASIGERPEMAWRIIYG